LGHKWPSCASFRSCSSRNMTCMSRRQEELMKSTTKTAGDKAESKSALNIDHLSALLYEALETEMGGVKVYETALTCAKDKDLRKEWEEYLEQTRRHVEVLEEVFEALGLETDK